MLPWISLLAVAAPIGTVPVQGVLSAPGSLVDGPTPLTLTLRAGATVVVHEAQVVHLVGGSFATALGATTGGFDLASLAGADALTLTVTVNGLESPAVPVGWAPRAAWAADAGRLGGQLASVYAVKGQIAWSDLDAATIPPSATEAYAAGSGLSLTARTFSATGGGAAGSVALTATSLDACPASVSPGTIRYDGAAFQGCTPTGWQPLTGGAGGPDGSAGSPAASCKQLYADHPSLGSGAYWLANGASPFQAWCDMTPGDAGWTLALRTAASSSTFTFYSAHWTTATTLNVNTPTPTAAGDAKYQSFNVTSGTEIRGCLKHPGTGTYGCKSYNLGTVDTLVHRFATIPVGSDSTNKGLFFDESAGARLDWLTYMGATLADTSSGAGAPYVRSGINLDDDISCYNARVRFGLLINNQSDVNTANDAAGFGASGYGLEVCDSGESALSVGAGLATTSIAPRAGTIWVR